MKIDIGGGKTIDLNVVLSAAINFILIAAVVYFLIVLPYNTLRKRGEVEQADDAQIVLLTEIRDLLAETNGGGARRASTAGTPRHRRQNTARARTPKRSESPPAIATLEHTAPAADFRSRGSTVGR